MSHANIETLYQYHDISNVLIEKPSVGIFSLLYSGPFPGCVGNHGESQPTPDVGGQGGVGGPSSEPTT